LVAQVRAQTFDIEQHRLSIMAQRRDFMPMALPLVPELEDGAGPAIAARDDQVQPGAPGALKSCPTFPLNKLQ
jgi:hypothetical protein